MSKIVRVEAATAVVPLDRVTAFSNRTIREREYGLVRVTTEDGAQGIGFCYAGTKGGSLVTQAVRELLAPVLLGDEAHRVEGLWRDMYQETILHGRTGSVMRAISAVDIALWDRNARAADLPLWQYLGSVESQSVAAYASGGYYRDGKGPEQLADEMRAYLELGFRAVKLKVGRLDPGEDEDRIAAVREAIGPDVLMMLDANNAWSDLPSALLALRRWEPYDPYWIEEPFSPDDVDNHVRLAGATHVLVATGEIEAGRWRHRELLEKGAAAILQTDAAVCGGITEFRRIAATADSFGVTVCPHWFHDLHIHLVGSSPNARFVEYFADDQVLNFARLLSVQLSIEDGRLLLPRTPGLGFDFAEEERYLVDGWG
jgi:L-alanine-DL-glutamate epimerase-like enolase superfamily enzyme